jgi:hypothetical protein
MPLPSLKQVKTYIGGLRVAYTMLGGKQDRMKTIEALEKLAEKCTEKDGHTTPARAVEILLGAIARYRLEIAESYGSDQAASRSKLYVLLTQGLPTSLTKEQAAKILGTTPELAAFRLLSLELATKELENQDFLKMPPEDALLCLIEYKKYANQAHLNLAAEKESKETVEATNQQTVKPLVARIRGQLKCTLDELIGRITLDTAEVDLKAMPEDYKKNSKPKSVVQKMWLFNCERERLKFLAVSQILLPPIIDSLLPKDYQAMTKEGIRFSIQLGFALCAKNYINSNNSELYKLIVKMLGTDDLSKFDQATQDVALGHFSDCMTRMNHPDAMKKLLDSGAFSSEKSVINFLETLYLYISRDCRGYFENKANQAMKSTLGIALARGMGYPVYKTANWLWDNQWGASTFRKVFYTGARLAFGQTTAQTLQFFNAADGAAPAAYTTGLFVGITTASTYNDETPAMTRQRLHREGAKAVETIHSRVEQRARLSNDLNQAKEWLTILAEFDPKDTQVKDILAKVEKMEAQAKHALAVKA